VVLSIILDYLESFLLFRKTWKVKLEKTHLENVFRIGKSLDHRYFGISNQIQHIKTILSSPQLDHQLGIKSPIFGRCISGKNINYFQSISTHRKMQLRCPVLYDRIHAIGLHFYQIIKETISLKSLHIVLKS